MDVYRFLKENGISGLEIAPGLLFFQSDNPFQPSPADAARALAELDEFELSLTSMQSLLFGVTGAHLFGSKGERDRLEQGMERAIELAGNFSIPNLVFGSPKQRIIPEGMLQEEAIEIACDVFNRLGDRARQAKTVISIESNPAGYGTNFLTRLTAADNFVTQLGHPNVATILDIGAMIMNDEFELTHELVPTIAPRLNHVHLSEPYLAPAPHESRDLSQVWNALAKEDYDKYISIEMKRPDEGLPVIFRSLSLLRTQLNLGVD